MSPSLLFHHDVHEKERSESFITHTETMTITPLVDVAFQELSILHLDRGRACCFGNVEVDDNIDFEIDAYQEHMQIEENNWSSIESYDEINVGKHAESNLKISYCFPGIMQLYSNVNRFMRQIPTYYCIDCVAMISPSSMASLPLQKQLSSSTHESCVLTVSTHSSPGFNSDTCKPDQLKYWINNNTTPLIRTGLRNWKVWRRFSDFCLLERKISDR